MIKRFEGFRAWAYQDEGGTWTIGWGHTRAVAEYDHTINVKTAEALLAQDIEDAESDVRRMIGAYVPTQQQFDALVSFVFNMGGAPKVETGKLFTLLRAGKPKDAAAEFIRWVHVDGKVAKGLITRRQAERDLFLEGTPA